MKFFVFVVIDERVIGLFIIIIFALDIVRLVKLRRVFWFVVVISVMMVYTLFSSETFVLLVFTVLCVLKEAFLEIIILFINIAGV